MDATASGHDPLQDIIICTATRARLKTVMRFKAPDWEHACKVFYWKAAIDPRVLKHVLDWDEVRILMEQKPHHVQVAKTQG